MRLGRGAVLLLAAVPFLAGCAAFWAPLPSSTSGGCTTNCSTSTSGYFYILNAPTSGSPQIVGEQIIDGKLTAISGSPWTPPSLPYAMTVSPSGSFLYLSTTAGVYVYPITSGALGTAAEVSSDVDALALQVDPSGTWLIEALQATPTSGVNIAAIPLNTTNGQIQTNGTEQSTPTLSIANAAIQDGKIAVSGDDKYIFAALGKGGTVIVPFNASAVSGTNPLGTASTLAAANASGSALSVAVDPGTTPRLFYVGETLADTAGTSGGLRAFEYSTIASGTLTQASGSPIASGGLAPNSILPVGTGYLYVANGAGTSSAGNIAEFTVASSGTNYIVAAGSTIAAGVQPYALAEDSSDTFLLSVNSLGSPYFSSYTFSTSTSGQLVDQIFTNTGTSPVAIVAAQ